MSHQKWMTHWTRPPIPVCFQPSGWLPACLSQLTFFLTSLFFLPFSLLNFFLFFRVHFLLIPHPPFKFHSAFNHISSFPCSPFLSPFTVSSLFLFLFSPFIAITSPYIPLLFDFLINFQKFSHPVLFLLYLLPLFCVDDLLHIFPVF